MDSVKDDWTKLQGDFNTLTGMSPTTAAAAQSFSAQAQTVLGDVQTLEGDVSKAKDTIDNATVSAVDAVSKAQADVKKLVANAETDAYALFQQAKQDAVDLWDSATKLFGLADQFQTIAQIYKPVENGQATFTHTDKGLVGGDATNPIALHTYDQLQISVYTIPTLPTGSGQAAKSKQIGDTYTIYGWNKGRGASITAIGFFPRAQTKHWQYTAIQGWSYKFVGSGMSMDEIRTWVPGFGISVEALDQQANGQQSIGVGAMITLLDDRIVGGYGYDTSGKGGYWYVGYRLRL